LLLRPQLDLASSEKAASTFNFTKFALGFIHTFFVREIERLALYVFEAIARIEVTQLWTGYLFSMSKLSSEIYISSRRIDATNSELSPELLNSF
jgi:hypothetical protein